MEYTIQFHPVYEDVEINGVKTRNIVNNITIFRNVPLEVDGTKCYYLGDRPEIPLVFDLNDLRMFWY